MSDAATPPEVDETVDGTTVNASAAEEVAPTDRVADGGAPTDPESGSGTGRPAGTLSSTVPDVEAPDEESAGDRTDVPNHSAGEPDTDGMRAADTDSVADIAEDDTDTADADTNNDPAGDTAPPRAPLSATSDRVVELTAEGAADRAMTAVRDGECIVLPTDTVYGIGADAFSASAVQRLLDAKGRGRDMPPPVLVAEPSVMMALATDVPDRAKDLASKFWPGALTLILKSQPSLMMDLGETGGTIAVRVPDHDALRELLRRTGPLAVSSANASGQPAATDIDDAREQLGQSVAVYLDGGAAGGDAPSTIVDFTRSEYGRVLRRGKISVERLREVIPFLDDVVPAGLAATPDSAEDPTPGQSTPAPAEAAVDPGPKHPFGAGFGSGSGSTAVDTDSLDADDTENSGTADNTDITEDTPAGTDDVERLPDGTPASGTADAAVGEDTQPDEDAHRTPGSPPQSDGGDGSATVAGGRTTGGAATPEA